MRNKSTRVSATPICRHKKQLPAEFGSVRNIKFHQPAIISSLQLKALEHKPKQFAVQLFLRVKVQLAVPPGSRETEKKVLCKWHTQSKKKSSLALSVGDHHFLFQIMLITRARDKSQHSHSRTCLSPLLTHAITRRMAHAGNNFRPQKVVWRSERDALAGNGKHLRWEFLCAGFESQRILSVKMPGNESGAFLLYCSFSILMRCERASERVPHILRSISSSYNSIKLFLISLSHPHTAAPLLILRAFLPHVKSAFYLWQIAPMPFGFALQSKVKPIGSHGALQMQKRFGFDWNSPDMNLIAEYSDWCISMEANLFKAD